MPDPNFITQNKIVLTTGENYLIPMGTPHVVAAIGDQPAHGLMITVPSALARLIAAVGTQNKNDALDTALLDRISAAIGDEIIRATLSPTSPTVFSLAMASTHMNF